MTQMQVAPHTTRSSAPSGAAPRYSSTLHQSSAGEKLFGLAGVLRGTPTNQFSVHPDPETVQTELRWQLHACVRAGSSAAACIMQHGGWSRSAGS